MKCYYDYDPITFWQEHIVGIGHAGDPEIAETEKRSVGQVGRNDIL